MDKTQYQQVAGSEKDAKPGTTMGSAPTSRKFMYFAACAGNLAAFTCGQAFGWTSPVLPQLETLNDTNPLGIIPSQSQVGWIGSSLPLGAAIGPFAAGFFADKIGRKRCLLLGNIPFIIAFFLFGLGQNIWFYLLGRFLCGLSVGITFTVLPMYIGEIAEDDVRGSLGSFMQLFIVLGLLFAYGIGPYMSIKLFSIICVGCPVIFLVIFFVMIPDSPYYLVMKGKRESAEKSLMKLRTKHKEDVQKEMEIIQKEVDEALAAKGNFFDIFKSKGLTKALMLSLTLVAIQQFSGINIVLFYTQNIFIDAGSSLAPELCTIIIGVVQVVASAATPLLVERRGKRFLLMLSALGMAVSQCVLGFFFYLKDGGSNVDSLAWLPVVSLLGYIITYCLGFGPLPWAVMGELFPANIKSAASTATASFCWILGFIITRYFGLLTNIIGSAGGFGFFGVCCFVATVFVYFVLPETSGKSLQEIQDMLSGVTRN